MVTSPDYRQVPTGTLGVLAQRLGTVWGLAVNLVPLRLARPRLRVHPAKPKIGLRTTRANEMWHIDTTVIRLLDGTRAYLHAVIDNFSRRILAWRVADTFAPISSVTVLLDASRAAAPSDSTPVVLADAGVENVNAQVHALIETGVLRRLLAFTELKFSNSMIEAWWLPDTRRSSSRASTRIRRWIAVDFVNLTPRLRQHSVQETLSNLWLDHLFNGQGFPRLSRPRAS